MPIYTMGHNVKISDTKDTSNKWVRKFKEGLISRDQGKGLDGAGDIGVVSGRGFPGENYWEELSGWKKR